MIPPHLPPHKWTELKQELVSRWQELSDADLEKTQGRSESLIELLEQKVGMTIEKASQQISEMVSHYRLYDEPTETETLEEPKKSRVLELKPRKSEVTPKKSPRRNP